MSYRLLRWTARLLYSRTHVTLLRLWQTRSGVLRARWRACGTPRLTWPLGGGSRSAADIEVNYMEVIATYCFSSSGMIYEHRIDTVVPPEPPLLLWPVMMAARLFGGRQGMGEGRHVPIPEAANK